MKTTHLVSLALITIAIVIVSLKFFAWNYTFKNILPKNKYEVSIDITARGFNQPVNVSTFLPVSDNRQTINNEINKSPGMNFLVEQSMTGRTGEWNSQDGNGLISISYSFDYIGKSIRYEIDSSITVPSVYPPGLDEYLKPTDNIQVNHPQINQIFIDKIGNNNKNILDILTKIQAYTLSLKPKPFKGVTDALTAARLGEASCNGKSRLFIALARNANLPTRLIGGIILEPGSKKTSHQWVEVYIQNEWVPFDPLNNHFAFIPQNYLALYKGDEYLFTHTPNINFNYSYNTKVRLSPNPKLLNTLKAHPFNAYKLWQLFETIGIPLGLLKIILLLPLGAFIVALFRNVIGIQTFGVFLPALLAIGSRETGIFWGMIAFLVVIGIVSMSHFPLERWGILYTPKLVIMLVLVVLLYLATGALAISLNIIPLAYLTLFPIVVLTISAERFARTINEEGFKKALWISFQTIIVTIIAFFAMNSESLEAFFMAFPELFLVLIGLSLLLGQWIGIRMSEFIRFKVLLK